MNSKASGIVIGHHPAAAGGRAATAAETQLAQAQTGRLGSWEWDLATGLVVSSDEALRLSVRAARPRPFEEAFRSIDVGTAGETLETLRRGGHAG